MNYNVIYYENDAYEVIHDIAIHMFLNKNKSVNQQVLGLYVHEFKWFNYFFNNTFFHIT